MRSPGQQWILPLPEATGQAQWAKLNGAWPGNRRLCWVAMTPTGRVVGAVLGLARDGDGYLVLLGVSTRGVGLGTRLLQAVEQAAAELGLGRLVLGARPESRDFYLARGFAGRTAMTKPIGSLAHASADSRAARLAELRRRQAERRS